jgi:hypothetical protein
MMMSLGYFVGRSLELAKPFKAVVDDALRRGLAEKIEQTLRNISLRPHDFGPAPGLDLDRLNQLVDELEAEDYLRKANRDDSAGR